MDGLDEPKRLNIAMDYDGTYTASPALFGMLMAYAESLGHRVYVVTMRTESEGDEVRRTIGHQAHKVICTSRQGKQAFCERAGVRIDIWIDDMPQTIVENWPT
jgi:hypothetical protein